MHNDRPMRADGHPVIIIPPGRFERLHWRLRHRLPMWIVYRPITREYPGVWVARMHVTLPTAKPTRFVITHDTLSELRNVLPRGLHMLNREQVDAPQIEEIWL
jgi:hypothetical protein